MVLGVIGAATVLGAHSVSPAVTAEDRECLDAALAEAGYPGLLASRPAAFDDQLRAIQSVQDAALTLAPHDAAIPFGQPREPCDLWRLGFGQCFDRSRFLEKAFRELGLETRYAAVYSTARTNSRLKSLLTPGIASHAVVEVRTARGWMLVDSNMRWLGWTEDDHVVSLAELGADPAVRQGPWNVRVSDPPSPIFEEPFTYVFGLYSRHGFFYPPYNRLPDISWSQLHYNLGR
ncbi:MAG: transglutaminase domain-containing protein [Pseudomonadota bacterium]